MYNGHMSAPPAPVASPVASPVAEPSTQPSPGSQVATAQVAVKLSADDVEAAAMQLPLGTRLALADRLIDSGAPKTPPGEADLSSVLRERIRQVESGEVKLVPWEVAQERVREKVRQDREARSARQEQDA